MPTGVSAAWSLLIALAEAGSALAIELTIHSPAFSTTIPSRNRPRELSPAGASVSSVVRVETMPVSGQYQNSKWRLPSRSTISSSTVSSRSRRIVIVSM